MSVTPMKILDYPQKYALYNTAPNEAPEEAPVKAPSASRPPLSAGTAAKRIFRGPLEAM